MTYTVPIQDDRIVRLPEEYVRKRIEFDPNPVNYANDDLYPVMVEFNDIDKLDFDFLILFNPANEPGPGVEIHLIGTDGKLRVSRERIPETATEIEMVHDSFYVEKDDYYGENILCTFLE